MKGVDKYFHPQYLLSARLVRSGGRREGGKREGGKRVVRGVEAMRESDTLSMCV